MDPSYLTTKEVAELLRVRERKVYDMVAANEIPHRKVTGKLLFPQSELTAWIEGDTPARGGVRPAVVAGSHDPLLDWAIHESGAALATLWNGSTGGLGAFCRGEAALTGLHIAGASDWNIDAVAARGVRDAVLIGWAGRARGLILAPAVAEAIDDVADLRGRRVVLRQEGAGATALLDRLLAAAGLTAADLSSPARPAHTESDAAAAVAAGEAEATLGIEASARQFGLVFRPLMTERFDLLVDRRAWFTEAVQRLAAFMRSDALAAKADALGGYDIRGIGAVRWLSP